MDLCTGFFIVFIFQSRTFDAPDKQNLSELRGKSWKSRNIQWPDFVALEILEKSITELCLDKLFLIYDFPLLKCWSVCSRRGASDFFKSSFNLGDRLILT